MTDFYKLGIIGYPIGHSLSPILYDVAFRELNLKCSYDILPTNPEDLISQIKTLKREKYFGFNVTIPHKVPMTLFLSEYDEFVNLTGSVNTIKINEDSTLSGFNTDVYGFIEGIPKDVFLHNKHAAVIGTGGASRAICAGLYKKGISKIDIYTRNIINSKEAIDTLRNRFNNIEFKAIQMSMMEDLSDIDILVNTTPLGMKYYEEDASPIPDKIMETLKENVLIYDIVYNPLRTALISKAIKYNKRYVTGLDMLVHQAVRATEIYTNQKPDFKAMKIAALEEFLINPK